MIAKRSLTLTRQTKKKLMVTGDFIALPLAMWSALALRLGEWQLDLNDYWPGLLACMAAIFAFASLGLYKQVIRYMDNQAIFMVVKGVAFGALATVGVAYILPMERFPRSVPAIFWMVATFYVLGTRFLARIVLSWLSDRLGVVTPIIVYGAGRRGVGLVRLLAKEGKYHPVAFIDDDATLENRTIDNLRVHLPQKLTELVQETGARQVWVTLSLDTAAVRRKVFGLLEHLSLRARIIPDDIEDLHFDHGRLLGVRDVRVSDLLGRKEVEPEPHLLRKSVAGRRVMVTGAGGSIGSELCRQIVRQGANKIVLVDHAEYNLYRVEQEVRQICAEEQLDVSIASVLGSVTSRAFIGYNITRYGVETLYHAAAYKHVSQVENNVVEGIKNNTFGTIYTAEEAMRLGVKDFILISTDKAVRSINVMGVSKRLAEMALQALQQRSNTSCFSIVRFGNVLNSSGSVVPLFLEQIEKGGPITVTHREVTRYFMTIREAAQLVMQAAGMAKGGDVFLLDMGNSIKIVDLAIQMARLKGYSIKSESNPDGDIEIQFTGLGRGEKLHEDILVGSDVSGTAHNNILRTNERFMPWPELRRVLDPLERACDNYEHRSVHDFALGVVEGVDWESLISEMLKSAPVPNLRLDQRRWSG